MSRINSIKIKNIYMKFNNYLFGKKLKFKKYKDLIKYINKINLSIEKKEKELEMLNKVKLEYISDSFKSNTPPKEKQYLSLNETLLEMKRKNGG